MFSAIRRRMRFSPATAIAGLALVFAMTGGAYAAKKYLITSTKQISPSVLKSLQGKAGPAGAQGPQGPAGPAGKDGTNGANGKDGTNGGAGKDGAAGKSVVVTEGAVGCNEGGITVEVEGSSSPREVCNGEQGKEGKEGALGTAGTVLPSKVTETGFWAFNTTEAATAAGNVVRVPLSLPIPLETAIALTNIKLEGNEHCKGSVAAPTADPGFLCIYQTALSNAEIASSAFPGTASGKSGALALYKVIAAEPATEHATGYGSFAVTAP